MDLLRSMVANRQQAGLPVGLKTQPKADERGERKVSKKKKAEHLTRGSRDMRKFIIEEKPSKKMVREHFESLVEQECVSDSDED